MFLAICFTSQRIAIGNIQNQNFLFLKESFHAQNGLLFKSTPQTLLLAAPQKEWPAFVKMFDTSIPPPIAATLAFLVNAARFASDELKTLLNRFHNEDKRARQIASAAVLTGLLLGVSSAQNPHRYETENQTNFTKEKLHASFVTTIAQHPFTKELHKDKALEKKNRLLRLGDYLIAPITITSPAVDWYLVTNLNKGFWVGHSPSTAINHSKKVTCGKLNVLKIPHGAAAFVARAETHSQNNSAQNGFFQTTTTIPSHCERIP